MGRGGRVRSENGYNVSLRTAFVAQPKRGTILSPPATAYLTVERTNRGRCHHGELPAVEADKHRAPLGATQLRGCGRGTPRPQAEVTARPKVTCGL